MLTAERERKQPHFLGWRLVVSRPALPTLPPFLIPKVSLPVACEAPPKLAQLTLPLLLPFPLPGMSFVTGDRLYVAAQTERSLTIPSPE